MSNQTKPTIDLPSWDDCAQVIEAQDSDVKYWQTVATPTPLEEFIYAHQPIDRVERVEWTEGLKGAMEWVLEQHTTGSGHKVVA